MINEMKRLIEEQCPGAKVLVATFVPGNDTFIEVVWQDMVVQQFLDKDTPTGVLGCYAKMIRHAFDRRIDKKPLDSNGGVEA